MNSKGPQILSAFSFDFFNRIIRLCNGIFSCNMPQRVDEFGHNRRWSLKIDGLEFIADSDGASNIQMAIFHRRRLIP